MRDRQVAWYSLRRPRVDTLWQDLRVAARMLRVRPGSTLIACATLALGIAANTTVFSAVSAILLRPLPIPEADRVVFGVALRDGFDPFSTSLLEVSALSGRVHAFASSGAARRRQLTLLSGHEPLPLNAVDTTFGYFRTLQVPPERGRLFTEADDRPGASAAAIVSYDLWQRAFDGRADILGHAMTTDAGTWTVVGVMPRGFDLPGRADLWMAARVLPDALPLDERARRGWDFVARLRAGLSVDAAAADAHDVARQLEREWPRQNGGWSYTFVPIRRSLLGDFGGSTERSLVVLMGAVGCVLLICCANVAALLLVRGIARQREIALRAALGAGRFRLARQLLTESAVLAVAGGIVGVLIAAWTTPLVGQLNPLQPDAFGSLFVDFRLDRTVLAFAAFVTLATGGVFGLVPALHAPRHLDLAAALKRTDARGGGRSSRRWMGAIVVGEIAVAAALIASASLIVQSFTRLRAADLGFQSDHILTAEIPLAPLSYPDQRRRNEFASRVLARVRALPGVIAAGTTTNLPLDRLSYDAVFTAEGTVRRQQSEVPITANRLVSPGYLETLGVRLVEGRLVDERDRAGAQPTVVVTKEFARQAWPGADPIGRRVRQGAPEDSRFPWLTVVGVVADVKEDTFNFRIDRPAWYVPYAQAESTAPLRIAVRTAGDPTLLAGALRDAVHAADPRQGIGRVRPLADQIADVTVADRFSAALVGALAATGIFLAACGLYGVVAYSVGQRSREMGVRIALGAGRADIVRLVVGEGALLVVAGVGIGLVSARGSSVVLASLLFEIGPGDVRTFGATAFVVAASSLAACLVPAIRAARLSPTIALRAE